MSSVCRARIQWDGESAMEALWFFFKMDMLIENMPVMCLVIDYTPNKLNNGETLLL